MEYSSRAEANSAMQRAFDAFKEPYRTGPNTFNIPWAERKAFNDKWFPIAQQAAHVQAITNPHPASSYAKMSSAEQKVIDDRKAAAAAEAYANPRFPDPAAPVSQPKQPEQTGPDYESMIAELQTKFDDFVAASLEQQSAQQKAFDLAQLQIQEQTKIAEQNFAQQQRQLQISAANQGMAGSGQVQFSQSKADRKKLTSAGTAGYFGRQGLRIKGLNVAPTTTSTAGSFA